MHGESMLPTLRSGDLLVVRYGAPVTVGRLVLARFPEGVLTVKRVVEARGTPTGDPGWWLLSDNPEAGVDSRHRGVIADTDVVATVVARLWRRPGRL